MSWVLGIVAYIAVGLIATAGTVRLWHRFLESRYADQPAPEKNQAQSGDRQTTVAEALWFLVDLPYEFLFPLLLFAVWPVTVPLALVAILLLKVLTLSNPRATDAPSEGQGGACSRQVPAVVGREGRCVTDLRPSGVIEIDGRRHDAITDSYIARGRRVTVTARQGDTLRVEPAQDG